MCVCVHKVTARDIKFRRCSLCFDETNIYFHDESISRQLITNYLNKSYSHTHVRCGPMRVCSGQIIEYNN